MKGHMTLTLDNWSIIELCEYVATGKVEKHRTIITDPIVSIIDGYLVTRDNIYKLGQPCRTWMGTAEAQVKLAMFDEKKCVK